MMRPATSIPVLFLLALYSPLIQPAVSACVPRGSITIPVGFPSPYSHHHPPPPPTTSSPSPPTTSSPSPPTTSPPPLPTSTHPSPHTPTTSPRPPPTLPFSTTLPSLSISAATNGLDNLLKSFCRRTDFSDLCLKTLNEALPTLKEVNSATILSALMKAVDAKAHEARAFAQNLAADTKFDARTRGLIHDCMDNYDDALDNLDAAREAINAGDAGTRDAMLSAMISNFGTCEDGFQDFNLKSPMAHWSQTLQNMTDNCLAIINISSPQDYY